MNMLRNLVSCLSFFISTSVLAIPTTTHNYPIILTCQNIHGEMLSVGLNMIENEAYFSYQGSDHDITMYIYNSGTRLANASVSMKSQSISSATSSATMCIAANMSDVAINTRFARFTLNTIVGPDGTIKPTNLSYAQGIQGSFENNNEGTIELDAMKCVSVRM